MKKYSLIILIFLFIPLIILAENGYPESGNDIIKIFENIVNWLWRFFIVITAIFFIIAGAYYFTSGGDPTKLGKANKMVQYGIVGVVVGVLSGSFLYLIQNILKTGVENGID